MSKHRSWINGFALFAIIAGGCASEPTNKWRQSIATVPSDDNVVDQDVEPDLSKIPLVGSPHQSDTPAKILPLDIPDNLALRDQRPLLRWTFFLSAGRWRDESDHYAIWLNNELIYHNAIDPPGWIPEIRHFESEQLVDGEHMVRVVNVTNGKSHSISFSAEETKHIVIFDRRTQPMTIRAFPMQVPYR